jgi:branched-chain amino acid transport system ATP-binding protein
MQWRVETVKAARRHSAFDIIRNEHRAIAAVVHCFEQILKEVRDDAMEPPFDVFELVVRYLEEFPDRFHHPKEDDFLFPALVERDPDAGEVIRELQQQHDDCVRQTTALGKLLAAWKADPEHGFAAFDRAAQEYIVLQWEHLRLEESDILPAAREKLTAKDWEAIDQAFNENEDPIFGSNPKAAFDGLFRKIVATAPAPWGLGTRNEPKRDTMLSKIGIGRG